MLIKPKKTSACGHVQYRTLTKLNHNKNMRTIKVCIMEPEIYEKLLFLKTLAMYIQHVRGVR